MIIVIYALVLPEDKPKILIIGDSISIGYTPFVKDALKDKAEVYHNRGNAQFSQNGIAKIQSWLGNEHWDIIQFNWGLWDLAYRTKTTTGAGTLDKARGQLTASPEQYRQNLEQLVRILEQRCTKLVFVTTTYVPPREPGRFSGDEEKYNEVAVKVMREHHVMINDLHKPSVKIHNQFGLGEDNVHYTRQGYQELAKYIVKFLAEQI